MAATAWSLYNDFKNYVGKGGIVLSGGVFRMALFRGSSNVSTFTLSTYASLTSEVTTGNGYVTGGQSLSAHTWAQGTSAKVQRFDATANIFSASGAAHSAIQFAVIYQSGGLLVAWSKLSTSPFDVTDGNTLTVTPSGTGYFELT